MNNWDGTYIARPIVDRGISEWSAMAEEQERRLPKLLAEVEECLAGAPWGGGAEGRAFHQAHFQGGGPTDMLTQCARLSREVVDAGTRLRAAVDNTLQTDLDLKHDLETGMAREV